MRHRASPGVLRGSGRRLRQQLVLAGGLVGTRVPSRGPLLAAAATVVAAAHRPWRVSVGQVEEGEER
jgi:hypothetical protein